MKRIIGSLELNLDILNTLTALLAFCGTTKKVENSPCKLKVAQPCKSCGHVPELKIEICLLIFTSSNS